MTGDFMDALRPAIDRACAHIRRRKARFVGIQLPDGLRSHFREIAAAVEKKTGAQAAMLVEMCCGACMADSPSGFDFILHVAHDEVGPAEAAGIGARSGRGGPDRILFIPYRPKFDVERCVRAAIPLLRPPVGVLTTSTHAGLLSRVVELLNEVGLRPLVASGKRTGRKAVVLGCDFSAARKISKNVSTFLFIGSGAFHPVGVMLATGKPVVGADPYEGKARTFSEEKDRILRRRFAAIEIAREARVFGVMLGLYPGQSRKRLAVSIKKMLEMEGKEAFILAARRFDPDMVAHLGLDALVSTACTRIALDDTARYPIPVLSPPELDIVLGKRKWDDYELDEIG
jgi:2-(3-amino-3-carboxypropyl)histidine synthase